MKHATDTPEYLSPAGNRSIPPSGESYITFDLNGCAGFLTGLDVGAKYIRTDERYNYVLVIGAYAMSKYLDKQIRRQLPVC
ncbi:MAG: hypothetical protein R3B93_09365 [Bacteroidia bacterium]